MHRSKGYLVWLSFLKGVHQETSVCVESIAFVPHMTWLNEEFYFRSNEAEKPAGAGSTGAIDVVSVYTTDDTEHSVH